MVRGRSLCGVSVSTRPKQSPHIYMHVRPLMLDKHLNWVLRGLEPPLLCFLQDRRIEELTLLLNQCRQFREVTPATRQGNQAVRKPLLSPWFRFSRLTSVFECNENHHTPLYDRAMLLPLSLTTQLHLLFAHCQMAGRRPAAARRKSTRWWRTWTRPVHSLRMWSLKWVPDQSREISYTFFVVCMNAILFYYFFSLKPHFFSHRRYHMFLQAAHLPNKHLFHQCRKTVIPGSGAVFLWLENNPPIPRGSLIFILLT